MGKAIQVSSTGGAANTIIDAHGLGIAVSFVNGETTASVLSGFTITGGLNTEQSGAGIMIQGASPIISSNVITGNESCGGGTGILIATGSPVITNNVITNNTQFGNDFGTCGGGSGGGILISGNGRRANRLEHDFRQFVGQRQRRRDVAGLRR